MGSVVWARRRRESCEERGGTGAESDEGRGGAEVEANVDALSTLGVFSLDDDDSSTTDILGELSSEIVVTVLANTGDELGNGGIALRSPSGPLPGLNSLFALRPPPVPLFSSFPLCTSSLPADVNLDPSALPVPFAIAPRSLLLALLDGLALLPVVIF